MTIIARAGASALALATCLASVAAAQTAATAPTPSAGQSGAAPAAPSAPAFPDSPLGRLGAALMAAVNEGDSVAVRRFVDAHLEKDARGRSPAVMAAMLMAAHAQSGGFQVERVRMAGPSLRIMARAREVKRWLGFELVPSESDSSRVSELGLYPTDDPGIRRPPAPWATGKLAEDSLASLIRAKVRAAADSDRFSGIVLVAKGDRVLVHEPVGKADIERGTPVTASTTFEVASVGKMFTGVAVMQLVERGLLRLDDTLARLLPDYPNVEAARQVTIRRLLTHTAGLPEPFNAPRFEAGRRYASHAAMLRTFADRPHRPSADTSFQYSNGNYAALAAVVEKVSGLPYEEYLRRHVWSKAGMRSVRRPGDVNAPERAMGYARFTHLDPLGLEPRRPETVRERFGGPVRGFGAGAYTAEDLFRFARALRAGRLLRPDLADSATTGRAALGPGMPFRYAFGFYERRMPGTRVVGHSGSNPDTGHDADVEMLWEGEWTVVVLSNYDAPAGMMLSMPIVELLGRQ